MNHITLYGNVGKDPEVKIIGDNKKVARFSLATTRRGKDKDGNKITDWHNIILWDKLADLAGQYVKKGHAVIIEGEIQYRNYDKDGQKVYMTEIIGNQMHFVGKKEETKHEPPVAKDEWQGKKEVKSMSDINELPGAEDVSNLPF